jgi:hypothetical protein
LSTDLILAGSSSVNSLVESYSGSETNTLSPSNSVIIGSPFSSMAVDPSNHVLNVSVKVLALPFIAAALSPL